MSGSLIGALRVTLGIDTAAFEEGLGVAQKRLAAAGKSMQAVGDSMAGLGQTLTLGVTAPLLAAGAAAIQGAQAQAQAMAQVEAALASMGSGAGRTAEQLLAASDAMELNSLFDGDEILSKVTANLLTFGNVAGEQFDRAQQAAVDMATRMGTDLQSAAVMVGKALNDPIKGIGALRKVGVQLTDQQEAMIETMVKTGNVAGAQGIILDELGRQFGGAGKAAADTSPWRRAQVAIGQVGDKIGEALGPVIERVSGWIERAANAFNQMSPNMQTFIVVAGGVAAALGPVLIGVGAIVSAIGAILPVLAPVVALIGGAGLGSVLVAAATAAAPFIAAGAAIAAIWSLGGDKIGAALKSIWEGVQEAFGPAMTELVNVASNAWEEFTNSEFLASLSELASVIGNVGLIILKSLGGAVPGIIKALGSLITGTFKVIVDAVKLVYHVLTGDWAAAWEDAKNLVKHAVEGIGGAIAHLTEAAIGAVKALYQGVKDWIGDKLAAIWDGAKKMIQGLGDKFKWLWDVVVGHSYIPDMVDAIGANMARLDALMVKPATKAADAVAQAFEGLKQDVAGILDQLFPLQAELRAVMTDIGKLDQAKAKGLLNDQTYDAARAQLDARRRELQGEINPIKVVQGELDPVTSGLGDLSAVLGELPQVASQAAVAMQEYGRALGDNIMGGLRDVLSSRTSFGDMIRDLFGNFLYRLTTDALKNIETAIFGDGGLGGFLGGVLSGLIGGKAIGGPVLANQPYIVGEKRAELFVPSTAGRIEPNLNGLGRGAGNGGPIEVRVTKSNLFEVEVTRIADGRVSSGIAGYDRNVGSRVKDNMSRRG